MVHNTHIRALESLEKALMNHSCTLDGVLMKVLEDFDGIEHKRAISRGTSKRYNDKKKDLDTSNDTTEKKREDKIREEKIREEEYPYLCDVNFGDAFHNFLDMRKSTRSKATEKAQELILIDMHKHDIKTAIEMLKQSTKNSWKGIFPLKTDKQQISKAKRTMLESAKKWQEKIDGQENI